MVRGGHFARHRLDCAWRRGLQRDSGGIDTATTTQTTATAPPRTVAVDAPSQRDRLHHERTAQSACVSERPPRAPGGTSQRHHRRRRAAQPRDVDLRKRSDRLADAGCHGPPRHQPHAAEVNGFRFRGGTSTEFPPNLFCHIGGK